MSSAGELPALFLARAPPADAAHLSAAERAHLARLTGPKRAQQSLRTHALLHCAMDLCFGSPEAFEVLVAPDGRPHLAGGPELSLSHSGELAAVLVSAQGRCGVDVEDERIDRDFRALATAAWGETGASTTWTREAFYAAWCLSEARFKAGAPGAAQLFRYGHHRGAIVLPRPSPLAAHLLEEDRWRRLPLELERIPG